MLFNSKIFVAFLALVILVYYRLPDRGKVVFLLVMSYVFYGFWDPWLLSLILLSTAVDFVAAQGVAAAATEGRRKAWLGLSLAVNLGLLGFFKYHDFFVSELVQAAAALGLSLDGERYMLHLVLPVGISFYTFQTLGYTVDVYRREVEPERNFLRFALYVSFFPQLVAGPVERAAHLLPQFARPFRLSRAMVREGVFLVLLGFVKKVVIADRLARIIAPFYEGAGLAHVDGPRAAAAQLLFTCQIYVDFSSYSDIAIGLGLLLGYHIRPNFDLPFVVPSIPERWRRWHLSMSEWFRDYIFIPLGGSRKGVVRTQANILAVMFLSGLWHGASNNFLVWGLLNGATMVGHRLLRRPLRWLSSRFAGRRWTERAWFYLCCWNTFLMIASINIFFRTPDWPAATRYVRAIFLEGLGPYLAVIAEPSRLPMEVWLGFAWLLVVFLAHEAQRYLDLKRRILSSGPAWALVSAAALALVASFGIRGPQFIYYQF